MIFIYAAGSLGGCLDPEAGYVCNVILQPARKKIEPPSSS